MHPRRGAPWRLLLHSALLWWLLWGVASASATLIELTVEAEDEASALTAGLETALLRLAGVRSPELDALVEALLDRDDQPWLRARERRGQSRFLLAFDQARLQARLEDAQVPVWVGSRPALLAWVVLEQGERRLLLGSAVDQQQVLASLQEWAGGRALPMVFPLGDLEDRQAVNPSDVVGGVTEALSGPSQRYAPDGLLLLHLIERGDTVRAQAWVAYRGREVYGRAQAATAAEAGRVAVAQAVDALGRQLARVLAGPETIRFGFTGIGSLAELQALRARLNALDGVRSVQLGQLLPGAVLLDLRSGLDGTALAEVLAAEGFNVTAAPQPADGRSPDGRSPDGWPADAGGTWFRMSR